VICYTDHPALSVPMMPGAYKTNTGFVYAILGPQLIKIGASKNPRARIREHCADGYLRLFDDTGCRFRNFGVRKILIGEPTEAFRANEKRLHLFLVPFRYSRTREVYAVSKEIRIAIEHVFASDFTERSFAEFLEAVRSKLNFRGKEHANA